MSNAIEFQDNTAILRGDPEHYRLILAVEHAQPHAYLGSHPAEVGGVLGAIVRAYQPDAEMAWVVLAGNERAMTPLGAGLFATFIAGAQLPFRYRLTFQFSDGSRLERGDPYRFLPTLGDMDLHLFNEGTHRRLWEVLGAHTRTLDRERGTSFAVWAPNAKRVSLMGQFTSWDGRQYQMRCLGSSGVWEIFIPGIEAGELYQFELKTKENWLRRKSDPMAFSMELPPAQASRVAESRFEWNRIHLFWVDERMVPPGDPASN